MSFSGQYGGFQLTTNIPVNIAANGLTQLKISVLGAGQMAGTQVQFVLNSDYGGGKVVTTLNASGWTDITVPLSSLSVNPTQITQITVQNFGFVAAGTSILYFGSIGFN